VIDGKKFGEDIQVFPDLIKMLIFLLAHIPNNYDRFISTMAN